MNPLSLNLFFLQFWWWFGIRSQVSAHLAWKCCPITTPVPSSILRSQALKWVLVIIIVIYIVFTLPVHDAFFLCVVINARTNRERNWEKLMRKSNESIPHYWTSRNRISLSLFIHVTTLSSLCAALKKKERTTKRNFERRDDASTLLSFSLLTLLLYVFINNTQFKDFSTVLLLRVSFSF